MRFKIIGAALAAAVIGCDKSPVESKMPTGRTNGTSPSFAVMRPLGASGVVVLPSGAGSAAEEDMLRRIALKFSPDNPDKMVGMLRSIQQVARSSDPEFSAMMSDYYRLRDTRLAAERAAAAAHRASNRVGNAAAAQTPLAITVSLAATPLPDGAKAYVLRRAGADAGNTILLGADADAVVLGSAIRVLRRARATDGDDLDKDERIVLQSSGVRALGPRLRAALDHELTALRHAEFRAVKGLGTVRAFDRTLPAAKAGDLAP
jgi:hypothetical protein